MSRPAWWAASATALAAMLAVGVWSRWSGESTRPAAEATAPGAVSSHLALPPPERVVSVEPAAVPVPASRPVPPSPPRDIAAGIGSEGFGPHVQRALDSDDPRQALEAARWIASCRPDMDVESMINGTHPKYRLVLPADQRAAVITNERQNQRYCQTLTPDLMAQHQALALRALEAKVPGAGLAYYDSLNRDSRSPAELERALRGLRVDAEDGQEMAVPLLALQSLGQSRVEQLAYTKLMDLLVLKNLLPPTAGLALPKPPEVSYTPEEQAEAAGMLKRLWPRFGRPG
jgi:hypothetical protein